MDHNPYLLQPAVLCVISFLLKKEIQFYYFQDLNETLKSTLVLFNF